MATVLRPPFYVPRPPDDYVWQGAPVKSPIIRFLTQQKMFGAGGQVREYRPNFTYDDQASWLAAPVRSPVIRYLTQQRLFGAGGQVPPFRPNFTYDDSAFWLGRPVAAPIRFVTQRQVPPFRWNFTLDDPPAWQISAESMNSAIIQNLTQQRINGQGGQVLPFRWNFAIDDPPSWQPTAHWSANSLLLATPAQAPFSNRATYWISEDAFWQGAPTGSAPLRLLTGGGRPFSNRQTYWYSEDTLWAGSPSARNAGLYATLTAPAPFANWQTRWYSEDAYWSGSPIKSPILSYLTQQREFGAGGQVLPFRWNFTYDDPASWQPTAPRSANSLLLTVAAQAPFSNRISYWYAEDAFWQGTPAARNASLYAAPAAAPVFNWQTRWYSEDAFWQGAPAKSPIIANLTQQRMFGAGGQAPPFRPNFTLDDASIWSGTPVRSPILSYLTQQRLYGAGGQTFPRWPNLTLDDPPSWQWPLYGRNANVLIPAAPTIPVGTRAPVSWYSDDAYWSPQPAGSYVVRISALTQQPANVVSSTTTIGYAVASVTIAGAASSVSSLAETSSVTIADAAVSSVSSLAETSSVSVVGSSSPASGVDEISSKSSV